MNTTAIPIIDAHVALGTEHHLALDVVTLVAAMDASGVSTALARPMGAHLAVDNAAGNSLCLTASPRIKALATATPWAGNAALDELRRAKEMGALALFLHPTRQGFLPTDAVVEPLIATARQLDWPVVFHTGTYIASDVLGIAEVARRHRDMTFLCDSAGFTDMWFELPGLLAENDNLHLIASLIWPRAVMNTVTNFGAQRVLFGSGAPRDSMAAALKRVERMDLSPDQLRLFLHDNAARIFRIGGAA